MSEVGYAIFSLIAVSVILALYVAAIMLGLGYVTTTYFGVPGPGYITTAVGVGVLWLILPAASLSSRS